jgi:probable HAF family extracellular repeat protein
MPHRPPQNSGSGVITFAPGSSYTTANDINAKGSIVGTWIDADGVPHGFLADGAKFTSIDYPGSVGTTEWGINSAGQMVGNWFDSDGNEHGWVATPGDKGKPR